MRVHSQDLGVKSWRAATVRGFTVVEVLIVMAVTGMLFVSAAIAISGKQNQTAFDQSIRQIQSQVQQTLNEVAVGYYPNSGTFRCVVGGAGPVLSVAAAAQGTNSGCIFLGKAMQFKVHNTNPDPDQFTVYTIAGLQQGGAGGAESSTLAEAKPIVVAPSVSHTDYPDNSVTDKLQNGLTTTRMWYNNGGADVPIGAVAFVNSLAQYGSGTIVSGSGQVNVVPLDNTALNAARDTTVESINSDGGNRLTTSPINPSGGVFICFASGGTNQYGVIKIGGSNRQISVTLTIKNNPLCT